MGKNMYVRVMGVNWPLHTAFLLTTSGELISRLL